MKKWFILAPLSFLLIPGACTEEDDNGLPTTPKPELFLESTDLSIPEGDADTTILITVRLSGLNLTNVVVNYELKEGSAKIGQDFTGSTSGKFLFSPANTTKVIELTIRGDKFKEEDETFELILLDAANATLGNDRITITILNDDINPADFIDIPSTGYTSPDNYAGYNLVWEDQFEGEQLNTANWTWEMGDGCPNLCGWGNNELQYYKEENTLMSRGFLVLEARRENAGGKNFTSSRIITKDKREFQFGRVDIRAVMPEGKGLWPALWMLGANIDQVSWPACGEIDIMELTGERPNRVIGTAHFGADLSQHRFRTAAKFLPAGQKFSNEFHVFSIIWEQDRIQWLVDDEIYHTITPADLGGQPYPFNQPFFFIFNVAVGGNLPGAPNETTLFPQRMIVDYIRVFQRS